MRKQAFLPVIVLFLCASAVGQSARPRFPAMEVVRGHVLAMLIIEPNTGSILDVNTSAASLYGYPYEVFIHMNISQINVLQEKDIKEEMQRAVEEKRSYFNFPHRFADGSIHMMEVYSSPVRGMNNESFLLSIVREKEIDSVIRKELAHYIERLNEELSQRIDLYNAVRIRQWIVAGLAALLFLLFGVSLWLFARYRRLASVSAADRKSVV